MIEKIKFYIEPRQSGKTSKIIEEYNYEYVKNSVITSIDNPFKLPVNCSIITLNKKMVEIIKSISNNNIYYNIFTQYEILDNKLFYLLPRRCTHKIFIDEYLFFEFGNIQKLNTIFSDCSSDIPLEIIIRTTAEKLINPKLYKFIVELKKFEIKNTISFKKEKISDFFHIDYDDTEIDYLYNNLLTHPKTELIINKNEHMSHKYEIYKIEKLGDLFKEDF